jgi:hypothetical protein
MAREDMVGYHLKVTLTLGTVLFAARNYFRIEVMNTA